MADGIYYTPDDEIETCEDCGQTLRRCRCEQDRDDECPDNYEGN